jgi:hypothetical protein
MVVRGRYSPRGIIDISDGTNLEVEAPITLTDDTVGFIKGSADGHILFWSESAGTWLPSDVTGLKWDSSLQILKVNTTTQTNRLLAGGVA